MKALVIVDVQRDFIPGGSLAVPDGDSVIPLLNEIQPEYELVCATQDWHPADHLSFASNHGGRKPFEEIDLDGIKQVLWPDHCVWESEGAGFADGLDLSRVAAIFRKGMDRRVDSYSGFFDNGRRRKTGLAEWLHSHGVDEVHVGGLAAEFCVSFTARDARELGFKTAVIEDGTRALSADAFGSIAEELKQKGVQISKGRELLGRR